MDEEFFPWHYVEESRKNINLQQKNSPFYARQHYTKRAQACPHCQKSAHELTWIYFSTPDWTWDKLCGKAGWLIICEDCNKQVDFFLEMLN